MLTRKQQIVLAAIRAYFAQFGVTPSLKEICALTGIRTEGQISRLLDGLQEHGFVIRERYKHRGITLVPAPDHCCPNCGHRLDTAEKAAA